METAQKKCLGIFDEAEEKVIAAGIIFMVLMETVNTIFKFVHPSAAGLPEELANFAYTWVAFLCASFCTKRRRADEPVSESITECSGVCSVCS